MKRKRRTAEELQAAGYVSRHVPKERRPEPNETRDSTELLQTSP